MAFIVLFRQVSVSECARVLVAKKHQGRSWKEGDSRPIPPFARVELRNLCVALLMRFHSGVEARAFLDRLFIESPSLDEAARFKLQAFVPLLNLQDYIEPSGIRTPEHVLAEARSVVWPSGRNLQELRSEAFATLKFDPAPVVTEVPNATTPTLDADIWRERMARYLVDGSVSEIKHSLRRD
jgi:hypothetical protein